MVRSYYIKDSVAEAFQKKYPRKASSLIQSFMEKMLNLDDNNDANVEILNEQKVNLQSEKATIENDIKSIDLKIQAINEKKEAANRKAEKEFKEKQLAMARSFNTIVK